MRRESDKESVLDSGKQSGRGRPGLLVLIAVLFLVTTALTFWRLGYLGGTSSSSASFMTSNLMTSSWTGLSDFHRTEATQDTTLVEWGRCPLLWPREEGKVERVEKSAPRRTEQSPVGLSLSGIIRAEDGSYAFINGKAVSLGEMIESFRLIEIGSDYVRVSPDGSDKTYLLRKRGAALNLDQSTTSHGGGGR